MNEWFLNDAILLRFYHGIDPNELTMPRYWGLLDYVEDILIVENGDTRDKLDRENKRRWEFEDRNDAHDDELRREIRWLTTPR